MQTKSKSLDLDNFDLEIEKTIRGLRKQKEVSMARHQAENKVLRDYTMPIHSYHEHFMVDCPSCPF